MAPKTLAASSGANATSASHRTTLPASYRLRTNKISIDSAINHIRNCAKNNGGWGVLEFWNWN